MNRKRWRLLHSIRSAGLGVISATLLATGVLTAVASAPAQASVGTVFETSNAPITGACVTPAGASPQHCEVYASDMDVWMRAAGMPAGTYFYAVVIPSGKLTHSTADGSSGNLSSVDGTYTTREFTLGNSDQITSVGDKHAVKNGMLQVGPFDTTTNSGGEYQIVACYLGPTGGTLLTDQTATDCTSSKNFKVNPFPVITATKSQSSGGKTLANGTTVQIGQSVTYTVALTNTGNATATDVTVTDTVPTGMTYVSCSGGASCSESSGTVTWSGVNVPAESGGNPGTASVSFDVTVTSGDANNQVISNVATYQGGNIPGCETSTCSTNTVTLTVAALPNTPPPPSTTTVPNVTTPTPGVPQLTVTKSSDPANGSTVRVGDSVVYTLALANAGTVQAANVSVTDAAPTGTSYVPGSATCNGLSGCTVTVSGDTITWSGITVPAAASNTSPGTASVSFAVVIAQGDTNNETVSNVASYSNENTPSCSASTCATNKVTLIVSVPRTAPAKASTPPASVPKPVVAPKPVVVPGATTVHTGEPWAGSKPLEVLVLLAGSFAAGLGELLRRRSRRLAQR